MAMSDPTESARRGRRRPRCDPAQRAAAARAGRRGRRTPAPADGRGEGRRLRPRDAPGGPGGPRGRGRVARGGHGRRGAGPARRPATPGGCSAGWPRPARTIAPLVAAGRRRDGLLGRAARRRSSAAPARPGGPRGVQLKFDTGLSRGGAPRSEWLALVHGGPRRRGGGQRSGSPGCGRTSPAPTSRTTRPTPRSRQPSTRRCALADRRRARARGPAPGQLGGRAAAPRRAARPGAAGHRRLRAQPGSGRALVRASSGWSRR